MDTIYDYIFNTKVVDNEDEHDGVTLVAPEAGSYFALVVAGDIEMLFEDFVGEVPGLQ